MTSSNGNIFRVTGPLFPAQRPVTRRFDVFCDLRLNKRLSKQSWGWWFETPSCSLWRHCNVCELFWEPECWNRSVYCICKPSLLTLYNYIYVSIFIIMLSYWGTPKFSKKNGSRFVEILDSATSDAPHGLCLCDNRIRPYHQKHVLSIESWESVRYFLSDIQLIILLRIENVVKWKH